MAAVDGREISDETILEWARFVEPYLEKGNYKEMKFAERLLKAFRGRLPHPPGCSHRSDSATREPETDHPKFLWRCFK